MSGPADRIVYLSCAGVPLIDADVQELAAEQATHVIEWHCTQVTAYTYDTDTLNSVNEWAYDDEAEVRAKIAQAVRVLLSVNAAHHPYIGNERLIKLTPEPTVPVCEKCAQPITTGLMCVLCPHGNDCALHPGPEAQESVDFMRDFMLPKAPHV